MSIHLSPSWDRQIGFPYQLNNVNQNPSLTHTITYYSQKGGSNIAARIKLKATTAHCSVFLTTVVNYFNIQEEDLETRMMKAIESQKPRLPSTTPKALQAGLVQSVGKFVLIHCTLQKNPFQCLLISSTLSRFIWSYILRHKEFKFTHKGVLNGAFLIDKDQKNVYLPTPVNILTLVRSSVTVNFVARQVDFYLTCPDGLVEILEKIPRFPT